MFSRSIYRMAAQAAQDAYSEPVESAHCVRLYAPETDIHGFVRWDGATVTVAIRGTHSPRNWVTDGCVALAEIGGMRVHAGFWRAFQSIVAQALSALSRFPEGQLLLTGHSMGAAVIKMLALHLAKQGRFPDAVITFGEPRQGDARWAKAYDAALGNRTVRVVHQSDLVPRIPVHWFLTLYRHTKNNLFFDALNVAHFNLPVWLRLPSDLMDLWVHWKLRGHMGFGEPIVDHFMAAYVPLFGDREQEATADCAD